MRCFISIDINDELQTHIKHIQEDLSDFTCDVSRISPNQGHVTLKYIGELDETTVTVLRVRLRELVHTQKQFKIHTTQINAFPSKKDASIIWLGIYPSNELTNTHKKVSELTNTITINKTKTYEYIPHITLARVKSTCNKRELQKLFKRVVHLKEITMNVNEIKLKQSTLTPQGPKYENVETFTLRT